MANYRTFIVSTTQNKVLLVTSSARKARAMLETGRRIDIWSNNQLTERIYYRTRSKIKPLIEAEKEYITKKQKKAEKRNFNRNQHKLYNESLEDDFSFFERMMRG